MTPFGWMCESCGKEMGRDDPMHLDKQSRTVCAKCSKKDKLGYKAKILVGAIISGFAVTLPLTIQFLPDITKPLFGSKEKTETAQGKSAGHPITVSLKRYMENLALDKVSFAFDVTFDPNEVYGGCTVASNRKEFVPAAKTLDAAKCLESVALEAEDKANNGESKKLAEQLVALETMIKNGNVYQLEPGAKLVLGPTRDKWAMVAVLDGKFAGHSAWVCIGYLVSRN